MARGMKIITALLLTALSGLLIWYYFSPSKILLSVLISVGVTAYHFVMRLVVGGVINLIFHNKIDYNLWWFRERKFEKRLYSFLKVRCWGKHIPTYSPDTFDKEKHTWQEITMATAQAEIVHEVIIIFSLLSMLFMIPFGEPLVFILTAIGASLFDLIFVIMQRYNRPKLVRYLKKLEKKEQ
ncbi:MAG: hypothetical protein IJ309_05540 [Clostridia bacterium]|nr:hypothetical protein [Clostridia bacterium]